MLSKTCKGMDRMAAYIWDLDGTLLDSYCVIIEGAKCTAREFGVPDEPEEILRVVKQGSLSVYLKDLAARTGVSADLLMERYRFYSHALDDRIPLIDGAKETLERLAGCGAEHYVYTHRGDSSGPILERLGILDCFREVVTAAYGFPSKPSGKGVLYLTEKYGLDPRQTWYVGDRALDVLCAKDAGVMAVLLLPEGSYVVPTGQEDLIVRSLREIPSPGT